MTRKIFVLAPDSFKESMTAKQVCIAMEAGLKLAFPDAEFRHVPMADGGEGTLQSLIDATQGSLHTLTVTGPLGNPVQACYGVMGGGKIAVIEMAAASGLHLVDRTARNPLITTSLGTGELILACLDRGIKQIILGIGGSATNDGGAGMAEALGVRFYDQEEKPLARGGGALQRLHRIDLSKLDSRLSEVDIQVACDVTNPLCGPQGASAIFGPQKGATPERVAQLDAALAHYAQVIDRQLDKQVARLPGAGAAGGLGAGLLAFTRSTLRRGVDIVVQFSGLREKLDGADFCFTGEGRIDAQTRSGKTPYGVAMAAKSQHVPVIAIAGCIGDNIGSLYETGIDAIFGIIAGPDNLDKLLKDGPANVTRSCENIGKLLKIASR